MQFDALVQNYGLPGIIIAALASVVVFLYRENRQLIKQLFEQQEARRLESLETAKEVAGTIDAFSKSTDKLIEKIEIVQGVRA